MRIYTQSINTFDHDAKLHIRSGGRFKNVYEL